jgi:L-fuconolactonase
MSTDPSTEAPVRVDAHHHVWDLAVRPQGWTAAFPPLDRTFTIAELTPQLAAAGVDGTVLVETIDAPEETLELLALAATTPPVLGVVGWVDLTAPDVAERIAELISATGGAHLVGLRHQVQAETDPGWLIRPEVLRGLAAAAAAGLVFDLLVRHHQLPAAIEAVRKTPGGRFALSHLGKPPVAAGEWEPWATHVRELAASGAVVAKLSGLVTEASPSWTVSDLEPYAAHAFSVFGPDRVMAGSDWPVCLLRADYETVWRVNEQLVSSLTPAEQDAVLGGTATSWYGLS